MLPLSRFLRQCWIECGRGSSEAQTAIGLKLQPIGCQRCGRRTWHKKTMAKYSLQLNSCLNNLKSISNCWRVPRIDYYTHALTSSFWRFTTKQHFLIYWWWEEPFDIATMLQRQSTQLQLTSLNHSVSSSLSFTLSLALARRGVRSRRESSAARTARSFMLESVGATSDGTARAAGTRRQAMTKQAQN